VLGTKLSTSVRASEQVIKDRLLSELKRDRAPEETGDAKPCLKCGENEYRFEPNIGWHCSSCNHIGNEESPQRRSRMVR